MVFPHRKLQRLGGYDYSQNGIYFITICTQNRMCLFGAATKEGIELYTAGKMVSGIFENVSNIYADIKVEHFVVMPNHIHGLLSIQHDSLAKNDEIDKDGTTRRSFPTSVSEFVQRFKTLTTKYYIDGVRNGLYPPFNKKIWEKSFYDHIIRDKTDFLNHWQYIDQNPLKWLEDKYFKSTV
ncbi:MAG TPA: transposase [Bellilinea sp.]|nr:transposase [Bellilinea sp.]